MLSLCTVHPFGPFGAGCKGEMVKNFNIRLYLVPKVPKKSQILGTAVPVDCGNVVFDVQMFCERTVEVMVDKPPKNN